METINLNNYGKEFPNETIIASIKTKLSEQFKAAANHIEQSGRYSQDTIVRVVNTIKHWSCEQKFPGAQPISFGLENLMDLQRTKTIVCEKTDGMRFFLLEAVMGE
jgi:hypothetical protein